MTKHNYKIFFSILLKITELFSIRNFKSFLFTFTMNMSIYILNKFYICYMSGIFYRYMCEHFGFWLDSCQQKWSTTSLYKWLSYDNYVCMLIYTYVKYRKYRKCYNLVSAFPLWTILHSICSIKQSNGFYSIDYTLFCIFSYIIW